MDSLKISSIVAVVPSILDERTASLVIKGVESNL
jgi:hypothetical protein